MTRIPQNIIDRVRDTAEIVEVISRDVDLKLRGANYFGLCPFHSEKTPSFSVAPAKRIYHCFGCGSGGNVFSYLMEHQKITFPEAVKVLADRYNIPIQLEEGSGSSELFSVLYDLHEKATELYQHNLFQDIGRKALVYLKSRGLTEDHIKQFKLGFSADSWDQLVQLISGIGITQGQAAKSGLFIQSEKGIFDRFRSRIMFPVFNSSGKVIAFGGRIFDTEDPAKYLNSPETPLYKKSEIFYGLQASRDAIRKEGYAVLVEGYMDFLQLYQSGIQPVLATSGTSFTTRHTRALNRFSRKVILLFDGDRAGGAATIRAGWTMLKNGIEPAIVRPPENKDPDDWIRESGVSEVKKALDAPLSFIDFHLDYFHGSNLEGTERKQYILEILREVHGIQDGIVQNDLIRILAQKLKVDESDLIRTMKTQHLAPSYPVETSNAEISEPIFFTTREDKAQIELLQLLIHKDIKVRKYVMDVVSEIEITHPLLKQLSEHLINTKLKVDTAAIIEYFSDKSERDSISKILFETKQDIPPEQIVADCLKILKSKPIKERIRELRMEIREKESEGHHPETELKEVIKLQQELNEL
tara:strand:+ start:5059 stop:6810 length:1752 start_codon:yes stop_codon:yes gene_type:complete